MAFFMSFQVYILYSSSQEKFYKGQTFDLRLRVARHNAGYEKSTRSGVPWVLVWSAEKESRGDALILEKKLKNLSRERLIAFVRKYCEGSSAEGLEIVARVGGFDP